MTAGASEAGPGAPTIRVTVVMPGRNVADHVDETLESIFAQTRLPDEIVVADGGSEDGTPERVLRHANRGVPLRVVPNETIYAGGGRNAATREGSHQLILNMDFANRADPGWLEDMVRCFAADPALDLLAGMHRPTTDTPFQRVCAAVVYHLDYLLPAMDREEIRSHIPPDFVAGGMCMAYRRSIWERSGGFSEWARKGQDVLFGHRVRRIGGKVDYTLDAMVQYHTPGSLLAVFDRHFYYGVWSARLGLQRPSFSSHALPRAGGLALIAAVPLYPWLLAPVAVLFAVYAERGAWRRLRVVRDRRGVAFRARDWPLSAVILAVRDAATVAGELLGSADRVLRGKWRRLTRAYHEHGVR